MPFNHYSHLNPADFGIPVAYSKTFTYVAAGAADDDDVETITYKNEAGNTIGVLTFTYVGSTNNVLTITRTA